MVALALTAGMLGAVNPCGFALLPAYLSVLVAGGRSSQNRSAQNESAQYQSAQYQSAQAGSAQNRSARAGGSVAAVGRALRCTSALTLGYALVFVTFGLVLTPFQGVLQPRLPWLTVVLGILLALAGGWLLAGRSLPSLSPFLSPFKKASFKKALFKKASLKEAPFKKASAMTGSPVSMVLFGMAYALASLGCALGPFLAIVVAGLRAGSFTDGLLPFVAYAAGMGLVIGVTAVAVALADHLGGAGRPRSKPAESRSVVQRLRRASAVTPRLSGAVLLITGPYVAWYGGYELRVNADRKISGSDPIVNAAAGLQERVSSLVSGVGAVWLVLLLATLTGIALLIQRRLFVRVGRI